MRNILILIEYDGTNYNGWQRQPNAASVQEEIEKAIYKVTKTNRYLWLRKNRCKSACTRSSCKLSHRLYYTY